MQEKLLLLRKRHKYSQQFIADHLGISNTTYSLKELGKYEFTADEMFKIKQLFNRNLEDIFMPRGNRNGDRAM